MTATQTGINLSKLLRERFATVLKRAKALAPTAEAVHQLRVSTRRASAALKLAKDHLPSRKRKAADELLHMLRKRAGSVRDHDVFLHGSHNATLEARTFLAGHTARERLVAFQRLADVVAKATSELTRLAKSLPRLEATIDIDRALKRRLRGFQTALTTAVKKHDPDHLHDLRLEAKHLRYLLEADKSSDAATLKKVVTLQTILGEWHDAHAMQVKLSAARVAATSVNGSAGSPVVKGIDELLKNAKATETKQLAAFKKWCKSWKPSDSRVVKQ